MLRYESYKCDVCGSVISKLFKNNDIPNSLECGSCGSPAYKFDIGKPDCSKCPYKDAIVVIKFTSYVYDPDIGKPIEKEIIITPTRDPKRILMN